MSEVITERYHVLVTAEEPIVHSEGIQGNIAIFRRQKYVLSNGCVIRLPVVSGNAMRNCLRRAAMWHAIALLGYPKLGKKAINLLFSGGTLDSSSNAVDVAQYRQYTELFPPLGMLGGGVGNALVPGFLRCGHLYPICQETTTQASSPVSPELVPDCFIPQPISAYMDSFQGTRKELFGQPKYQKLLTDGERDSAEKRIVDNKKKRVKGGQPDKGDSQQMIYEFECVAPGTRFSWKVGVQQATEAERDCFLTAVALFAQDPVIAAKSAVGFGRVKLEAKGLYTTMAKVEDSNLPGFTVGKRYEKHITDHGDEIVELLRGMG